MRKSNVVTIGNKFVGTMGQIYIIAEMACAHDGDFAKAKKLVDAAVEANADAVQLQFFSPDDLVTPDHEVYDLLHQISFCRDDWRKIYEYARQSNIHVFACTYDIPSAKLALELKVDGIKLNSSDLSNPDLLQIVAESKIPFTLGTGASTIEEIAQAVDTAMVYGGDQIIIMHGVQNFPTAIEHANINKIKMLHALFPFPVGYQDHTDAADSFSRVIDLLAIGAGACVIEKHITLDRSQKGTDYQAALEPAEFKDFVRQIRSAEIAIGNGMIRPLSDSDKAYRSFQKKSIVVMRNLEKGEKISKSVVAFMRSKEVGLPPTVFPEIEGKVVIRAISEFVPLKREDIEGS
ncbi:N-acetylneuraminate synthase family protein [bacterium]|nr:N-acetylneuraminate synthase family protein [bacterium]